MYTATARPTPATIKIIGFVTHIVSLKNDRLLLLLKNIYTPNSLGLISTSNTQDDRDILEDDG